MENHISQNTDNRVVILQHGLIKAGDITYLLPSEIPEKYWFGYGSKRPDYNEEISRVRAIVERCAPWAAVYVGPTLYNVVDEDDDIVRFPVKCELSCGTTIAMGGVVIGDFILLSVNALEKSIHHELWHLLEHYIHRYDMDFFNASLGAPEGSEPYWDSLVERRARYYEAWVIRYESGIPLRSVCGVPVRRIDRIMLAAHSGKLARERTGGLPSPARSLPGFQLVRRIRSEIGWQGIALATAVISLLSKGGIFG